MNQSKLPITINADKRFSSALLPLLNKMETWLNFQALKANWYGSEALTLHFHFTVVNTLAEKKADIAAVGWVEEAGVAYYYEEAENTTTALIAVADLVKNGKGIEHAIKKRLIKVCNGIAVQCDLPPIVIN